jgi:hypothetical protein
MQRNAPAGTGHGTTRRTGNRRARHRASRDPAGPGRSPVPLRTMTDYAKNHAQLPQVRSTLAGDLGLVQLSVRAVPHNEKPACDLPGVAGFEPATSSSRSQVHSCSCWAHMGVVLVSLSAGVRRSPCRTRRSSLNRSAAGPGDGCPAVIQSPSRPARGSRAYHREKKEHPENTVHTFTGIAADREKGNTAGTNADEDPLQQRARVFSFGWRCWLGHTREARVHAGVDFLVDFVEEGCHHRVAVLRA